MGGKINVITFEQSPRYKEEMRRLTKAVERFNFREGDFPPLPSTTSFSNDIQGLTTSAWPPRWKKSYSTAARYPCWFLEIPLEIRRQIYQTTMHEMGYFDYQLMLRDILRYSTNIATPRFLPVFCLTSKQIREETITVYLRNVPHITVANFEQNQFLSKFLDTVRGNFAWKALKALKFNYFAYFPGTNGMKNSDLELIVRCPGLEKLMITMHLDKLYQLIPTEFDEDGEGTVFRYSGKAVKELVEKYRFERLFECNKLTSIEWTGWSFRGAELLVPEVKKSLEDLAEWIKNEFEERKGQTVDTTVSWFQYR